MNRLAVILSHPTQYYSPWFRWVAQHTALSLRVFYLWDFGVTRQRDPRFQTELKWDVDLLSGYEAEFVPNIAKKPGTDHFGGLRNPELPRRLGAWSPDAVLLFGYKSSSHLRALAWARRRGVPALFRGDSHFLGRGSASLRQRLILGLLYRQFAAFLPVGVANEAYFQALGVPRRKLFRAPHSVNHALFDPTRPEELQRARDLRRNLGIPPEAPVVLFAGKFVPAKQPRELLEAFLATASDAHLVLVGEGSERAVLHSLAARGGAESPGYPATRVHFLPFANQSEMPSRYLLADVFALPSRGHYETWGLAVNEAMHMGVPALVSDRVGCQQDLVTPGETGWVFPAEDSTALRATLTHALQTVAQPKQRAALRERVQARIAGYTYQQTTDGLLAALRSLAAARATDTR